MCHLKSARNDKVASKSYYIEISTLAGSIVRV